MSLLIDAAWCKEHGAIQETIMRHKLGGNVRYYDRIWVLTYCEKWNHTQRNKWLAGLVERAWDSLPHPSLLSVAVIAALRRNHVPKELCDQARLPPDVYDDVANGKLVSCREYAALAAFYAATVSYLAIESDKNYAIMRAARLVCTTTTALQKDTHSASDSAALAAATKYGSDCSFAESFAALEYEAQIKDALEILRENP